MSAADTPPPHIPTAAHNQPIGELPEYSVHQLALRNGQDRDEIWFAYQGLIYDVTKSRLWTRGHHYEHWAGQDLTQELDQDAPHTVNVLDKFHVVGRLKVSSK